MAEKEIIEKINGFVSEEFEIETDNIFPTANLKETLDLDSLDYVDLVVAIEDSFGFKVVPEDFINIVTFQDFYDYVQLKVDEKETA